jgi:iron(III) transport system ATP-binding protein
LAITTIYVTHDQEEAMAISDRIAIMDSGLIVQIGSAEELYRRPTSRFVAGFLGSANLLRGTVVAVQPTTTTIDILGHHWELAAKCPVAPGKPVDAVVRPEALVLTKEGAGLRGRVESRTYYGDKAEYIVCVGDVRIQAIQWNPSAEDAFTEGQQVCIKLPASNVQLLAVE